MLKIITSFPQILQIWVRAAVSQVKGQPSLEQAQVEIINREESIERNQIVAEQFNSFNDIFNTVFNTMQHSAFLQEYVLYKLFQQVKMQTETNKLKHKRNIFIFVVIAQILVILTDYVFGASWILGGERLNNNTIHTVEFCVCAIIYFDYQYNKGCNLIKTLNNQISDLKKMRSSISYDFERLGQRDSLQASTPVETVSATATVSSRPVTQDSLMAIPTPDMSVPPFLVMMERMLSRPQQVTVTADALGAPAGQDPTPVVGANRLN